MKWFMPRRNKSDAVVKTNSAVFEGELGKYIRSNQVFKHLAQGRALRDLNRKQEAENELNIALDIAEKLLHESSPNDPWPIILRGHILKEADLLGDALLDYNRVLNNHTYKVSEEQRLSISAQAREIERVIGKSEKQAITTVYVCFNCGSLINFVTAKCPHCSYIPDDSQSLSVAMTGSSDLMGARNLLHVSRALRSGRRPYDVIADLELMAKKNWQRCVDSGVAPKLLSILDSGKTELLPNIEKLTSCANCGQELAESGLDKCDNCGKIISKSEVEKVIVNLTKIKLALESHIEIVESLQFDRLIEGIVFLWSYTLREQRIVQRTVARRMKTVLEDMKVICFQNRGAIYELGEAGKVTTHLVANNLNSEEDAIVATYMGLELNDLAVLLSRVAME